MSNVSKVKVNSTVYDIEDSSVRATVASNTARIIALENAEIEVDATLTQEGMAADAKKTGDEISDLKNAISGGGITSEIKSALLQLAQKVAYIDEGGKSYYDDLHDALYPPIHATAVTLNASSISWTITGITQQLTATLTPLNASDTVVWSSSNTSVATVSDSGLVTGVALGSATITATAGSVSATCSVVIAPATVTSISAVYTQSGTVLEDDSLDSLKSDLVVTATWSNQTTSTVASNDYTLSGTLTEGTSTITVSYGGKSTTFNVTVSAPFDYGVWTPTGSVITGYYISEETGEPVAYSGCGYWEEYIDISAIREAFVVTSTNSNFRISLYTADGTFTRQYHPNGVPHNAQLIERTSAETQMRLSYYNNSAPTFSILECLDMPMESGDINSSTGAEISSTNRIRSVDYISASGTMTVSGRPTTIALGNTSNPWGTATGYLFRCFDSAYNITGSLVNGSNVFNGDISDRALPTNTAYVRMEFQGNSLSSVEWTDYVAQAFLMNGTYYRLVEAS